jgi:hypothetical protein
MRRRGESGFAMLFVFVLAGAIAITLYMEMPRVAFESQRSREQVAIDRGSQYQRAIQLFFRKYRAYPQTLDDLETSRNIRFLRRRYMDPLTGKEWRLLHVGPGGVLTDSLIKPANPLGDKSKTTADSSQPAASATTDASGQPVNPGLNMAARRPSDRVIGGGPEQPVAENDPNQPQNPQQPQPGQPGQTPDPSQPGQQQYTGQTPIPGQPGVPGQPPVPGQFIQPPYPGAPVPGQLPNPSQPVQPGQPQFPGQVPYPGQPVPYSNPGQPGYPSPPTGPPGMPGQPYVQNPGQQIYPQIQGRGGFIPGQPAAGGFPIGGAPAPGASNQAVNLIQQILTTPRQPPANLGNTAVGAGGIAGVASNAEGEGIHVINEHSKYKEWEFVYDLKNDKNMTGGLQQQIPGQQIPGLPGAQPNPTLPGSSPRGLGMPQIPGRTPTSR